MREDGDPIPGPSSLDAGMNDPEYRETIASLVDVATRPVRPVINVMQPEDLVAAIDRVTNNRSRFLAEAAMEALRERADAG